MDLRDFPSPRNTWRRLWVLVTNLPQDSATVAALTGGASAWTLDTHLLAVVADALHAANWQRGGGKGRKPTPIPRPGAKDGRKERLGGSETYTAAEMDELLARNRQGGA